jgi:hypothetical protein
MNAHDIREVVYRPEILRQAPHGAPDRKTKKMRAIPADRLHGARRAACPQERLDARPLVVGEFVAHDVESAVWELESCAGDIATPLVLVGADSKGRNFASAFKAQPTWQYRLRASSGRE